MIFQRGPGFIIATPCPACLHTQCGKCDCHCAVARLAHAIGSNVTSDGIAYWSFGHRRGRLAPELAARIENISNRHGAWLVTHYDVTLEHCYWFATLDKPSKHATKTALFEHLARLKLLPGA